MSEVARGAQPLVEGTEDGARQVVHSAERVALHLPLAGPTSRMLAYVIDLIVLWSVLAVLLVLLLFSTPLLDSLLAPLERFFAELEQGSDVNVRETALMGVLVVAVLLTAGAEIVYFVLCELATSGRSPGKAALGLRVVRDGGLPIHFAASLTRNLLRVVDYLPMNYLTGFVAMVSSREGKRLGDLAAGTVVVRLDRPRAVLPSEALVRGAAPEAEARFRFDRHQLSQMGRPERTLLRQTLRRIEGLDTERADEVLERAVDVLSARIGYEEELRAEERLDFLRALLRLSGRA